MYRTHTCGELRIKDVNKSVSLSGWVQKIRNLGAMTFIDLRDRYGITQLVIEESASEEIKKQVDKLGREFVIQVKGKVVERASKNNKIPTGEIEILISDLILLSRSELPPFTIEDNTDGGDEIRMKYRYLDLRRNAVRKNLELRHRMAHLVRNYLDGQQFMEVETPVLIKSTPEGARDFVVPSRMNQGQFYALPQSPQTFKQLLMVAGFDRYYQIVKCFRDEDLRADRQPEFTQIDCEMSFVQREDVLEIFEGMIRHLFKEIKGIDIPKLPRMSWNDAMEYYGCDKPDIRFGMQFVNLSGIAKNKDFAVFNSAEYVGAICVPACASYTRKQLDELTEFVKRPQLGAKGLVYVKYNEDGTFKSSVDKFYSEEDLKSWVTACGAKPGDLLLILCGPKNKTLPQLCSLRLEMGERLGLRDKNVYKPLWVVDFPLLEWDEETQRFYAMHHPFTSPNPEDVERMESAPGAVRANAYDMVINGVEVGGGSIRIHDTELQQRMFRCLGFTPEQAEKQFGFLLNAFKYGAPPHGGIAFGFDRLVSMFAGLDSIRDTIAFPKNNSGRDVMIDSPSEISEEQFKELGIKLNL
ncbi:aspartate--tRNA ligase [uncultured Odoribacter sp.]|uniref:aspartate--tRNA ligase n=1 Tax=uncultured Odoribacter sp. TaxID=876416 RepID=UPI00260DF322|nr:aspartate--tRNA ligase [uncultured Odoribacter sp.]